MSDNSEKLVLADNLMKIYKTKDIEVVALQGLDLEISHGELMAIIGSSGSGKSTFLNMLGGLDKPSAGKLFVDGKNLFTMTEKELVHYKRHTVGFVWQNNGRNLLPYMTALNNVMLPMQLAQEKEKKERALMLLDMVGLSSKKNNFVHTMSGGEQQRVAIAIALANRPKLLLADEPTGSVDTKTSDYVFDIFRNLNKEWGQTILIVTHDVALSKKVQRVAAIRDGKISSERILKEDYSQRVRELGDAVDWRQEETQEEYAILDRSGRLQLPADMISRLDPSDNRVRVEYTKDGILIKRPEKESKQN